MPAKLGKFAAFSPGVVGDINAGQVKWGCTNLEEFKAYLYGHVDQLFESIKKEGYKTQSELGVLNGCDEVRVAIDRMGRFLFIDGAHRLIAAKL